MIMKMFQISFIFALVVLTKGEETKVNACSGNVILPKVSLYDGKSVCKQMPCKVSPGSTLKMDLNFTSPGYLEHIKPRVTAFVMGGSMIYPLSKDDDDACSGIINTMCPLVKNEFISYTISMTLPPILPSISLGLEFSITDQDTRDEASVVCFKLDLTVTNNN